MEPSRPGAELALPRDSAEPGSVEKADGLIGEPIVANIPSIPSNL